VADRGHVTWMTAAVVSVARHTTQPPAQTDSQQKTNAENTKQGNKLSQMNCTVPQQQHLN